MDIFVKYDPADETYSAIKQIALAPANGLTLVTQADLVKANEALAVFLFSDMESALAFSATMRNLAHEYVFGNFGAPDICGDLAILWFVDAASLYGGSCREPGLRIHDFRGK